VTVRWSATFTARLACTVCSPPRPEQADWLYITVLHINIACAVTAVEEQLFNHVSTPIFVCAVRQPEQGAWCLLMYLWNWSLKNAMKMCWHPCLTHYHSYAQRVHAWRLSVQSYPELAAQRGAKGGLEGPLHSEAKKRSLVECFAPMMEVRTWVVFMDAWVSIYMYACACAWNCRFLTAVPREVHL